MNIVEVNLHLLFKYSRFFGAFSYDDRYRLSRKWLTYSFVLLFLQYSLRLYSIYFRSKDFNELFAIIYELTNLFFEVLLCLMNVIWPMFFSEDLHWGISNFLKLEDVWQPIREDVREMNQPKYSIIATLVFGYYLINSALYFSLPPLNILKFVNATVYLLQLSYIFCILLQYKGLLDLSTYYYRLVQQTENLELSLTSYELLHSSNEQIHRYYTLYLLTTIAWCLAQTTRKFYYLLREAYTSVLIFALAMAWIPMYLSVTYLILHPSQKVVKEAANVFSLSRAIGIFPLDDKLEFSAKWLLYSLPITGVLLVIRIHELIYTSNILKGHFGLFYTYFQTLSGIIVCLVFGYWPIINVETLREGLRGFGCLQESINCCPAYWAKVQNKLYTKGAVFVYFMYSTLTCLLFLVKIHDPMAVRDTLVHIASVGLVMCSLSQYTILACGLVNFYDSLLDSDNVEAAVSLFEAVTSTCEDIHDSYDVTIFTAISWLLFQTILHMYCVMLPVFEDPSVIVAVLLWLPVGVMIVFAVVHSSERLLSQAKKFNEVLYWKMVEDKTGLLQNNERLNFHFIAKRELCFTACGFFKLDNSLICTMIATATTYLVISLQYGKSGLSPVDYQQLDNGSHGNGSQF